MNDAIRVCRLSAAGLGLMLVVISGCSAQRGNEPDGDTVRMGQAASAHSDSAESFRHDYQVRIARALNNSLGSQWTAHVNLVGEPEARQLRGNQPTWHWPQAAVSVTLVGQGDAPDPNLNAETIETFIRKVMRERMQREAPLAVAVTASRLQSGTEQTSAESTQPPRFRAPQAVSGFDAPALEMQQSLPTPAATPPRQNPRPGDTIPDQAVYRGPVTNYTVQQGDTWAAISIAFFGTPNHWRVILSANPDLGPADLQAGRSIRVPVEP